MTVTRELSVGSSRIRKVMLQIPHAVQRSVTFFVTLELARLASVHAMTLLETWMHLLPHHSAIALLHVVKRTATSRPKYLIALTHVGVHAHSTSGAAHHPVVTLSHATATTSAQVRMLLHGPSAWGQVVRTAPSSVMSIGHNELTRLLLMIRVKVATSWKVLLPSHNAASSAKLVVEPTATPHGHRSPLLAQPRSKIARQSEISRRGVVARKHGVRGRLAIINTICCIFWGRKRLRLNTLLLGYFTLVHRLRGQIPVPAKSHEHFF